MGAKAVTLVSYGQARPLCDDESVGCWEENIRINHALQVFGVVSPESGYLLRLRFQTSNHTKSAVRQVLNQAFLQRIHQAERGVR